MSTSLSTISGPSRRLTWLLGESTRTALVSHAGAHRMCLLQLECDQRSRLLPFRISCVCVHLGCRWGGQVRDGVLPANCTNRSGFPVGDAVLSFAFGRRWAVATTWTLAFFKPLQASSSGVARAKRACSSDLGAGGQVLLDKSKWCVDSYPREHEGCRNNARLPTNLFCFRAPATQP